MKKIITILSVATLAILLSALTGKKPTNNAAIIDYTDRYLDSLLLWEKNMHQLSDNGDAAELQILFLKGRAYYKQIEFLLDYVFPASANNINGAPLLEAEASHNLEPTYPKGFQVMEEYVYGTLPPQERDLIKYEASNISNAVKKIKSQLNTVQLSDSMLLDALKLNIYSMMIKGISGFDAPGALSGVEEAQYNLDAATFVMRQMPEAAPVLGQIDLCKEFLRKNYSDFNSFNRALFLKDYANKLTAAIVEYHYAHDVPFCKIPRAINPQAKNLFESNAWNLLFFAPEGTTAATSDEIALGKKLFSENELSSSKGRSCASCHIPEKAFTDGLAKNESISGQQILLRNTPTLINAALQPSQFYDSRISFLEDQIHDVITSKEEMNSDVDDIIQSLLQQKEYSRLFTKTYKKEAITAQHLKRAIAAYIRSLVALDSRFDRYMNGDANALTVKQIDGFNLFMGKAKCGTCHFMPAFNGSFPPLFNKIESEVLGVPKNTDTTSAILDDDLGKYLLYNIPHQRHSFKTVSVRNAALTAPYMHNGIYRTLEEVIDFYNRGGGAGIGIALENQTLAPDRLDLTIYEKSALIEFIKSLTDTKVAG